MAGLALMPVVLFGSIVIGTILGKIVEYLIEKYR